MEFALHERLAADTAFLTDWPLCRVLLMNDARYPWLILVPRRPALVEMHDLVESDSVLLMREMLLASLSLETASQPDKINVGALGNLVPQLHIHVVARTRGDAAWPGPVWGNGERIPYEKGALDQRVAQYRVWL